MCPSRHRVLHRGGWGALPVTRRGGEGGVAKSSQVRGPGHLAALGADWRHLQEALAHVLPYTLCATKDPSALVQVERGGLGLFGACFLETQLGWVGWSCPAQGPWLQGCVTVTDYLEHGRADTAWSKADLTLFEPSLEMNE